MFGLSSAKLILYGLAAAALAGAAWFIVSRIRISYQAELERDQARAQHASYKALVEQTAARAAARMERDAMADAELAGEIEQAEAEGEALRAAAARQQPTVEKPDASGIPRLVINPGWWLCQSAALSGDSADAAACKARSGSAGMRPDEGARRLPLSAGVHEPRAR